MNDADSDRWFGSRRAFPVLSEPVREADGILPPLAPPPAAGALVRSGGGRPAERPAPGRAVAGRRAAEQTALAWEIVRRHGLPAPVVVLTRPRVMGAVAGAVMAGAVFFFGGMLFGLHLKVAALDTAPAAGGGGAGHGRPVATAVADGLPPVPAVSAAVAVAVPATGRRGEVYRVVSEDDDTGRPTVRVRRLR